MKTKKKFLTTKKAAEKIIKVTERKFQRKWGVIKKTSVIIRKHEFDFYPDIYVEFANGYVFYPGRYPYDCIRYNRFGHGKERV